MNNLIIEHGFFFSLLLNDTVTLVVDVLLYNQ